MISKVQDALNESAKLLPCLETATQCSIGFETMLSEDGRCALGTGQLCSFSRRQLDHHGWEGKRVLTTSHAIWCGGRT